MNILFFTAPGEDYLADSLLHGFKSLFGTNVVDFPKCEILYKGCSLETRSLVRGYGFTLYSGLLDDHPVHRFQIIDRVKSGKFDLIIFSSIWRQYGWFYQLRPWLDPSRTLIFDGEDTQAVYPAAGLWWRHIYSWLAPRAHRRFLYFKREWTPETRFSIWTRAIPEFAKHRIQYAKNLRRVSFSFPEEKIVSTLPLKTKEFADHVVDAEVAATLGQVATGYRFNDEASYYADLQCSRFGITVKRAGWDCLRHYEIAGNGAVPCFRNLDKKPATCAPHGLTDLNSISYSSAKQLMEKISNVTDADYQQLQRNAVMWCQSHSTRATAINVLRQWEELSASSLLEACDLR